MQKYTTTTDSRAIQPEDVALLPPSVIEQPAQPIRQETNLGFILTLANLFMTGILITGMMLNGSQVRFALLIGGVYFSVSMIAFVFVITGALTAMVNTAQVQRTERLRVLAYRELGEMALEWRREVERTRQLELEPPLLPEAHRPDVEGVLRVSPLNTFVEPYADQERAALEAVRWAENLYDRTGHGAPDPRKVQLAGDSVGRLKVRMLGSKRGGGSRDAGVWLLRQGVIQKVNGGYALRLDRFPYRHYLHTLL